ncbi:MAG: peptidase-C39 like family protein [Candidatus Aureabacteria bacterium]|nr:peptidase-C39 like family protein [Candidatus Auribacterota bacterium]
MIPIKIMTQPDDSTCGPTCLQAVYNFYGDTISLQNVIHEVSYLEDGGTLAVFLACHALKRGYQAKLYTYDLKVFDPTWFLQKKTSVKEKLRLQLQAKKVGKIKRATKAFIEFIELGGQLFFENLTSALLRTYFQRKIPILAGLSATYLYQSAREKTLENLRNVVDDIEGSPVGHFVVLCGYDEVKKHIIVADPYRENPVSKNNNYSVKVERLINAILLGIVTYDANLLIIQPGKKDHA